MDHVPAQLRSIGEEITRRAGVESVFGDPIEVGDRTVVPVARVRYGFGGGYGDARDAEGTEIPIADDEATDEGIDDDEATDEGTDDEATDEGTDDAGFPFDADLDPDAAGALEDAFASMGWGAGGGATVTPVGVVEVTDEGTRFVRFGDRRRLAAVAVGGVALGLALGAIAVRGRRGRADAGTEERVRVPVE